MPYLQDIEYDLEPTANFLCKYFISSQHRRVGNPNKSIWILSHEEEIGCFVFSINSGWKNQIVSWGLSLLGTEMQIIGRNPENEELKIAKFVDGNGNNIWHGYPADYLRKSQDRPETCTLKSWVQHGYITKAKMSKIRLGQSCNL